MFRFVILSDCFYKIKKLGGVWPREDSMLAMMAWCPQTTEPLLPAAVSVRGAASNGKKNPISSYLTAFSG